jgi:histidinol phosphatase-like enzyme
MACTYHRDLESLCYKQNRDEQTRYHDTLTYNVIHIMNETGMKPEYCSVTSVFQVQSGVTNYLRQNSNKFCMVDHFPTAFLTDWLSKITQLNWLA